MISETRYALNGDLHAVDDEGVPVGDIASVIGRHLGVRTASITPGDAEAHFGWLAGFRAADSLATGAATRESLDWAPTRPGLIDDLDAGHYFRLPKLMRRP